MQPEQASSEERTVPDCEKHDRYHDRRREDGRDQEDYHSVASLCLEPIRKEWKGVMKLVYEPGAEGRRPIKERVVVGADDRREGGGQRQRPAKDGPESSAHDNDAVDDRGE